MVVPIIIMIGNKTITKRKTEMDPTTSIPITFKPAAFSVEAGFVGAGKKGTPERKGDPHVLPAL
jgi:hypothetical protein